MRSIDWLIADAKQDKKNLSPSKMTNKELAQLRFTFISLEDSELVLEELRYRKEYDLLNDDEYRRE